MTNEDDLGSFKIGDMRRPEVRNFKKAKPEAEPEPEEASVGFPAIEQRLEGGSIEDLAEELRSSYEQLEELAASGDMKAKAAAKRAMGAYERTADLFEYLFETKSAMQSPSGE
ncbi:MAG: hypothetical protein RMA76_37965 [Deltaproteobacteria bacterium]|jgi:hypothetical protein